MSPGWVPALAWALATAFFVVVAARVALTEARWPDYRVQVAPRRVVRGLDVLAVVLVVGLAVALATIIGPALLRT